MKIIARNSSYPMVGIIIVNWELYSVTAQCLYSLRSLSYPNFRIVLVDNGSKDGSGKKLKENFPEIDVLFNESNQGFTGGNNLGIQYALEIGLECILLLNNDTVITPDFLNILMDRMQKSQLLAIQPKIMYNHDRSIIWNAGGTYNRFFSKSITRGENKKDYGQYDHLKLTEWITGCCFLIKSSLVRQIGLLDEKFFMYHEDVDWSLKIRKLGNELGFEPSAVIYHEAGRSDKNRDNHGEGVVSPFSHYQGVRNHLFIIRRHTKGLNLVGSWIYQIIKITGYLVYFLLRRRLIKFRYVLRGAVHGLTKKI